MHDVTWWLMFLIGFIASLRTEASGLSASQTPETKDYCQSEYFNVTCPRSDVILMEHAQYGRMRAGRCVSGSYGVVGCSVDVLGYFDRKCSGRKHCNVYIGDPSLHKLEPCSKDFTTYLEAKYSCLGVASGSLTSCNKNQYTLLTPALQDPVRPGFIASASATDQGGIGTVACPWRIQVDEGQTIRFSLLSFGGKRSTDDDDVPGSSSSSAVAPPPEVCYEIGEIREGTQRTTLSMCGGSSRESLVYASTGYDVTLQLLSAEVLRGLSPFVIKYEVQGCKKLKIPGSSYIRVEGDTAKIQCNASKETWYATCTANRWTGRAGNCTITGGLTGEAGGISSMLDPMDSFPYGILIVVAIGVALGVLIGGILLSVVAYYMRRRGSIRRYVTDDVMKHTAGSADDDDVYNHETMPSASAPGTAAGRLLVSHYNVLPHQYPLLQGATVAYMPHHHHMHHHHHSLHQHAAATQSNAPTSWVAETTAIEDDINDEADRVDTVPQGTGGSVQMTCGSHTAMQTSSAAQTTGYVVGRQTPTFAGRHLMTAGGDSTIGYCGAPLSGGRGTCGGGGGIGGSHLYESPRFK